MSAIDSSPTSETGGEKPLSTAVVEAVGSATGTSVLELPPLGEVIDPDALNALFSNSRAGGQTEFRYAGCVVTVRADRTVDVSTDA